jgi:hypothetical protein
MLRVSPLSRAARILLVAVAAGVCLAQPSVSNRSAKVLVQVGQVSAQVNGALKALFVGDSVRPQQWIVTGPDSYAEFQVSDGSTFQVFANSKMIFREHAGNLQDLLNVVIGHVKVYIQHLNGQPNNNSVTSPTAVISVRGTVFDVLVEDDDGTTFVGVDEGEVMVRNYTAAGPAVYLHPGESVKVFRNQPLAMRQVDKGAAALRLLRATAQALEEVLLRRGSGGSSAPGGSTVPGGGSGGNSGDSGKGGKGGGTTPTAPGAPGAPTAPGAPGAP